MPHYTVVVTADPTKLTPNDNKPYVDWIRQLTGFGLMDAYTCFKEMRAGKPMIVNEVYPKPSADVPEGLAVEVVEQLNQYELEYKRREEEWDAVRVLLEAGAAGNAEAAIELCRHLQSKRGHIHLSTSAYAG